MEEVGSPGLVLGVSVNGKMVWQEGFGLADVENDVPCGSHTVMRVASISKSFTALAVGKLWEEGKLDLDKPIQEYLPEFPEKQFSGSKVTITLRHLLSHTSGIRHYSKSKKDSSKKGEFDLEEYYLTKSYKNISESLTLFQDDPLLNRPGEEFLYTTHGWTLISAILEKASGQDFLVLMNDLFRRIGMNSTFPDYHDKLIYGRSRYYTRDKSGRLINTPYVDNSYKWAGGGFLSTVGDLLKFANVMIYSYQKNESNEGVPAMLRSDTVKKMWTSVSKPPRKAVENKTYGLGWFVYPELEERGCCAKSKLNVTHTGGAVGASSVLFLAPRPTFASDLKSLSNPKEEVRGIAVAIICNMQSAGLTNLARSIAQEFEIYQ